jgi:hypothetical protein
MNIFVKLFSLLYADDTSILSETEADMQYALAIFEKYCHHWKLKVNFTFLLVSSPNLEIVRAFGMNSINQSLSHFCSCP